MYFAYGSNLCESRLVSRTPSARFRGPAQLDGHQLRFHKRGRDGTAKADAAHTGDDSHVWGAVAELDDAELAMLDTFEPGYARTLQAVAMGSTQVTAWVYRAEPGLVDANLVPSAWYLDHILQGGTARGLPPEYLARIAQTPTIGGTDPGVGGC